MSARDVIEKAYLDNRGRAHWVICDAILDALKTKRIALVELPEPDRDGCWDIPWDEIVYPTERDGRTPILFSDTSSGEAQTVYTKYPAAVGIALLAAAADSSTGGVGKP